MKLNKKQNKDIVFTFRINANVKSWLDSLHKQTKLSRGNIINQLLARAIAEGITKSEREV